MWYCRIQLIVVAVWLLAGCAEAPRDNPLDPASPYFRNAASVSGRVTVRNQAGGLPSVAVLCVEQGVSVSTDSNGQYAFQQLAAGNLTFIASRPGFVSDTQHARLDAGATLTVSFALNGAPVVLAENIVTHKYDQYYPSPVYTVDITASVTDPNGVTDLDSVWFSVDTLLYPMPYSTTTRQYQTTLYKYDFPTNTIDWLVGKTLTIRGRDFGGAIGTGNPFSVTRVIENTATPTYPTSQNNDTTGPTPVFKWLPPGVTFNYFYTLECLVVNAGTETLVWTLPNVNSTVLQQQLPGDGSGFTLSSGNYVWRITVTDTFGNSSRSKEAAFVVR